MYAILQQGGHQYRVAPGDRLLVDRLSAEVGAVIALEPVLLVDDGDGATVGSPSVEGARVAAVVVAHTAGRKLRVFTYKAKKRHRRTQGHRSRLTELRVEAVLAKGEPLPDPGVAEAAAEPARARRESTRSRGRRQTTPEVEAEAAIAPAADETPAETAATEAESASAPAPARPRRPRTRAPRAQTETSSEDAGDTGPSTEAD